MPTTDTTGNNYPVAGGPAIPTYGINTGTSTAGSTTSSTTPNTVIAGVDDTGTVRTAKTDDEGNLSIARLDSVNDEVAITRGPRGATQGYTKRIQTTLAAQEFMPARTTRRSLSITNEDGIINVNTNHVRWGYGSFSTADIANGAILPAGRSIEIPTQLAVWVAAVSTTGAAPFVSGGEDYDDA